MILPVIENHFGTAPSFVNDRELVGVTLPIMQASNHSGQGVHALKAMDKNGLKLARAAIV